MNAGAEADETDRIDAGADAEGWLVREAGVERGPLGAAYLRAGLLTGLLPPETVVRPEAEGHGDHAPRPGWQPLSAWPVFAGDCASIPAGLAARPAWDPVAIAWLGLLFSPLWSGLMAAVNARRLGTGTLWRPLVIGGLWLAVGLFVPDSPATRVRHPFWTLLSDVFWDGAFLGILYWSELRSQATAYTTACKAGAVPARWSLPAACGAPYAAMSAVFVLMVLSGFLSQFEVCEALLESTSPAEAEPFVTSAFRPQVAAAFAAGAWPAAGHLTLTEETSYEGDPLNYYVGYEGRLTVGGRLAWTEGYFHLVQADGGWRVEQLYVGREGGVDLPDHLAWGASFPAGPPAATPGTPPGETWLGWVMRKLPVNKATTKYLLLAAVMLGGLVRGLWKPLDPSEVEEALSGTPAPGPATPDPPANRSETTR